MENYDKLKQLVLDMQFDIEKIENNRTAPQAAIRARRNLQDIRELAKFLRQDIQDVLKTDTK